MSIQPNVNEALRKTRKTNIKLANNTEEETMMHRSKETTTGTRGGYSRGAGYGELT